MIRIGFAVVFVVFSSITVILYVRGHVDYENSLFYKAYSLIVYGYLKMVVNFCHGVDALKAKRLDREDAFYTYKPHGPSESMQRRELKLAQMKAQMDSRAVNKKAYKMKVLK